MKKNIFKSNLINFTIFDKNLYIKVKDLENINLDDMNKAIFIYKIFSLICFTNNLRYKMIIDLTECKYNIMNIYSNIKLFLDVLNLMKPITNFTAKYTLIIFNNSIIKQCINLILGLYKPSRPLYLISNQEDINNLNS